MWPFTCEETMFVAKIHNNIIKLDATPTFANTIAGSFNANKGKLFSHHKYTNVTIEFSPYVIDRHGNTIWDTMYKNNYTYTFDKIHAFPMGRIVREKVKHS